MKKFKKLIVFGIMTAMLTLPMVSCTAKENAQTLNSTPTAGEETSEEDLAQKKSVAIEKAKAIVKDYFDKDLNIEDFDIEVSFFPGDETGDYNFSRDSVSVNFSPKVEAIMGIFVGYYEDNGEVSYISDMNVNHDAEPIFSEEEGLGIAQKFLKEKTDLDLSQFRYKSGLKEYSDISVVSDYIYTRVYKDIEYEQDSITLSVDLSTGKVVYFDQNYTKDLEFSNPVPTLTPQEALDIAKENFKAELKYMDTYSGDNKAVLAYFIDTNFSDTVNAKTKKVEEFGEPFSVEKQNKTYQEVANLTKDIKAVDLELGNKEQAVKVIKEVYGVEPTDDLIEYSSDDMGFSTMRYTDQNSATDYYVDVSFSNNVKTVDIRKMRAYGQPIPDPEKPVISYKQAYDIALKELAKIAPEHLKQVDFEVEHYIYPPESEYIPSTYYFRFTRKSGDIIFPENYLYANIDGVTKTLESMGLYWNYEISFDSVDGIISPEKAIEIYLSTKTMELKYVPDEEQSKKTGKTVAKLVYVLTSKGTDDNWGDIDAKTGNYVEIFEGYGR